MTVYLKEFIQDELIKFINYEKESNEKLNLTITVV